MFIEGVVMIRFSKRLAACMACRLVSGFIVGRMACCEEPGAEAYARAVLGDAGLVAYWRLEADFAYARLPEGVGDPELKKRAVERMTTYAERVGSRVCLMGNLDPVELLWRGTPTAVAHAAQQAIEDAGRHGGFILGSGCEVPVATPKENLNVMIESARKLTESYCLW